MAIEETIEKFYNKEITLQEFFNEVVKVYYRDNDIEKALRYKRYEVMFKCEEYYLMNETPDNIDFLEEIINEI